MTNTSDRSQRIRVFLLLVAFCLGIYMLTYRALIQSGDTRRALDAVSSFVRYGDWLMDETTWIKLPFRIRESADLPLGEYRVDERLHILLASPLLRLAEALPRLGNIHTVWLFNVIITALTAGFIYLLLRAIGYASSVAAIVAISAGLGTNLWAYSQTFFRDPLTSFFIMATLLALQLSKSRGSGGRAICYLVAAATMYLAYTTKFSALFATPAVVIFALPDRLVQRYPILGRALVSLMAFAALVICILMLLAPFPPVARDLLLKIGIETKQLAASLRSYILSPGASVWATSPLLLLAIPGGVMLWRRGQMRLVAYVWLLFAGYALGHATLTKAHWFGGLSWPPRFLLPAVPVLMLLTAPLAQELLNARARWLRVIWVALLCYGLWIQFVGVSLSFERYGESLPPEAEGLAEWEPSQLQPRYFRWVVLPERWGDLGYEFLWTRANLPIWGLSFAVFSAVVAAAITHSLRQPQYRWRHLSPVLVVLSIPLVLLNLMSAYEKDPQTQSSQGALHEALEFLAANAHAGEVLLLPATDYGDFILNHIDSAAPRPVILERPLAQAASAKQPAQLVSENPNDWFDVQSFRTIRHIAGSQDRLWVLDSTSPYLGWSFRPLERYLAQHYYPLGEVKLNTIDETVRLLEYSTRSAAPNPLSQFSGDIATDLRYGENIRLLSFVLPNGASYRPGETMELSLVWKSAAPLEHDYSIAWFIAGEAANELLTQGRDTGPQDNFAPTLTWKPGSPIWDNRALRLPEDASPGAYQIWVLMYRRDSSGEITRLPVSGATVTAGGTIGVLPIALAIE